MRCYKKTAKMLLLAFSIISSILMSAAAHATGGDSLDYSTVNFPYCGNIEYYYSIAADTPSLTSNPSKTNKEFCAEALVGGRENFEDFVSLIESVWGTQDFVEWYEEDWVSYATETFTDYANRQDYYQEFHAELGGDYILATVSADVSDVNSGVYILNSEDFGNPVAYNFARVNGQSLMAHGFSDPDSGDGYVYHEDNLGNYTVKLVEIDETTIRADYILENLTSDAAAYDILVYLLGPSYQYDRYSTAGKPTDYNIRVFNEDTGAYLDMKLSPNISTGGAYLSGREMEYSWQGVIAADETKTFSVTYHVAPIETFDLNFYFMDDDYLVPETEQAMDGALHYFPYTTAASREGYHREWNTKKDGSGTSCETDGSCVVDKNSPNYYEIEVKNELYGKSKSDTSITGEFIVSDELKSELEDLAASSKFYTGIDTVLFGFGVDQFDLVNRYYIGSLSINSILKTAGDDYMFGTFLGASAINLIDDKEWDYKIGNDFPSTLRLNLPESFMQGKEDIRVVTFGLLDFTKYELLPTTFDRNTGELLIEDINDTDNLGIVYLVIVYTPKLSEDPEPEPEPFIPGVPNTGAYYIGNK